MQDFHHRAGIRAEDLHPEGGVAGSDAGDVTQAVSGQGQGMHGRALQPAGHERRHHLGKVRHERHGVVMFFGAELCHHCAQVGCQGAGGLQRTGGCFP
ncbi:hypothetical protein D9M72_641790 [compost metagenome]